jgi:Abnormal spindle-like microcephaly-assoc'd, ASPM-SPD-2-Hydin
MPLPRALTQSLLTSALMVLVLVTALNASSADQTTRKSNSYSQKTERLIFTPANLGFGSVNAGEQKVQTVSMTNAGDSEITLLQAIGQGTDFTLGGLDFPFSLASGESFTFTVVFAPRAPGQSSGSISFVSARSGVSNQIRMTGSATVSIAQARVSESLNSVGITAHGYSVELFWHASTSKHVIGYNIYRAIKAGGPYRKMNSALVTGTVYTDNAVVDGKTYYYTTTAVNSHDQESAYSKQTWAKIP